MWGTQQGLQAFKIKGEILKLKASNNHLYKNLLQIKKKTQKRIKVGELQKLLQYSFHSSSYLDPFSVLVQSERACRLQLRGLYDWKANAESQDKDVGKGMSSKQN